MCKVIVFLFLISATKIWASEVEQKKLPVYFLPQDHIIVCWYKKSMAFLERHPENKDLYNLADISQKEGDDLLYFKKTISKISDSQLRIFNKLYLLFKKDHDLLVFNEGNWLNNPNELLQEWQSKENNGFFNRAGIKHKINFDEAVEIAEKITRQEPITLIEKIHVSVIGAVDLFYAYLMNLRQEERVIVPKFYPPKDHIFSRMGNGDIALKLSSSEFNNITGLIPEVKRVTQLAMAETSIYVDKKHGMFQPYWDLFQIYCRDRDIVREIERHLEQEKPSKNTKIVVVYGKAHRLEEISSNKIDIQFIEEKSMVTREPSLVPRVKIKSLELEQAKSNLQKTLGRHLSSHQER